MPSASPATVQVCDLCGSPHYRVFARHGRHGARLTTVICELCGLVYTNPRPSEEDNAAFYHKEYWGQYKNQTEPDERFFRRRLPKIKPLLAELRPLLKPGLAVLEVGCSVGALLSRLKEAVGESGRVIGIEAHEGHARFAREKKGLDVRAGLLHEVAPELAAGSFDLVVMNHVLEHTTSPVETVTALKQLMRTDATLVIEVPNIEAPGSRLSHFFHQAHHYCFSPLTLRRLAQKTGFAVRRIEALDGDLPRTRLLGIFSKPATSPDVAADELARDDSAARATALRAYSRWYWLTGASFRKKITHWKRQRA